MSDVRCEIDGELAVVTLDRPERRNAMTPATWRRFAEIGRGLPGTVRVVLLRSEGPSFCAGLDRQMLTPEGVAGEPSFAELARMSDGEAHKVIAGFQEAFTWWRRTDLISIAAVQGHAVGAGFQLTLACDLRIAAQDARFAMLEPALGLVPDLGGTKPLVELVGYARALEICATTRWVDAAEAERIGLVNRVVPLPELETAARALAADLLKIGRDPVIETKSLLRGAATRTRDAQLEAERSAQLRRARALTGIETD